MILLVKEKRIEKGFSIRRLAKEAEISKSFLQKIEKGESCPTIKTLCKISKVLGVCPLELFSCE